MSHRKAEDYVDDIRTEIAHISEFCEGMDFD